MPLWGVSQSRSNRMMISDAQSNAVIEFTGLRPGEKLVESLQYAYERKTETPHKGIYSLKAKPTRISHRLSWLNRDWASFEETRDWLTLVLSQHSPTVGYGHLAVVKG